MSKEKGFGQFCPVAKAAEIVTTRWTPMILRELISGSTHFNEIHRGVPLMSRALLSKRLKELEQAGVIERRQARDRHTTEYRLTEAGRELKPIIVALGLWGLKWIESALDSGDWDAGTLMWDLRRRIDINALPGRGPKDAPRERCVIQFDYSDAPKELRRWWLVIEGESIDLCQSDPGYDVDLYIAAKVPAMARAWIGKDDLKRAIASGRIHLHGDRKLSRTIGDWLKLAVVAEAATQLKKTSGDTTTAALKSRTLASNA